MIKYDLTQQWIGGAAYEPRAKFNYLLHINRIPLDKLCYRIRSISPKDKSFTSYWKEESRRVFEGHWVQHQVVNPDGQLQNIAKWLPPWTHFHVNHWTIETTHETQYGKQKVWTRPMLRDLEWIRGYVFAAAKGFSGFEGDPDYTCYRPARTLEELSKVIARLKQPQVDALRKADGSWKEYREALPYLYEEKGRPLGKALFMNTSSNIGDVEARGSGKTYQASGNAGWGWVTEGMTDYDEYSRLRKTGQNPTTQQMFLSYDVAYQATLLRAFHKGLEEMPGGGTFDGYEKPLKSPLYKRWSGGILNDVGVIEQRFERKNTKSTGRRARSKKGGSGNMLHCRSLFADPTAGNGPRCSNIFIEEFGFCENATAAVGQLRASASDDGEQYGVITLSGTGGDTKGIATQEVRKIMENPSDYGCLGFANVMENIEQTIGMFVPGHLMLNKYKDEFGNTNFKDAEEFIAKEYAKAQAAKDPKSLLKLKTRLPRTLNDALLSLTGTSFPTAALTDVLTQHTVYPTEHNRARPGMMELVDNDKQRARFVEDWSLKPLEEYPIKFEPDMASCWMVLEDFDPTLPPGYYVGGCDPYNQDDVKSSESVGATYIARRAFGTKYPYDRIVAWYVGRPASYTKYYEQVRRGCRWYGAILLPENETTLVRDHFILHGSEDLLAPPPPLLKANIANPSVRAFGQNMSPQVKRDLVLVGNRWLIEPVQKVQADLMNLLVPYVSLPLAELQEKKKQLAAELEAGAHVTELQNMHFICDPGLLRELIAYGEVGNFDRVIAFLLMLAQLYQMRGNQEMAQAHSQLASHLALLRERKASSRRQGKRHIESLPAFINMKPE